MGDYVFLAKEKKPILGGEHDLNHDDNRYMNKHEEKEDHNKRFFEEGNQEDRDFFISKRIANDLNARLLPGSGVDLDAFNEDLFDKHPNQSFTFILIARLLKEKGIFA